MTNNKEQKSKRYYKKGQIVWSINLKKEVEVLSVNKKDLTITVLEDKTKQHTFPLWSVDVLKYKAKEKLVKSGKVNFTKANVKPFDAIMKPEVFIAKLRDDAIIPTKRDEDAGFDIYANVEGRAISGKVIHQLHVPANQTTLVPTGIAVALPKTHYLNAKHERGSTGKISMSVLAGVVDSGYRGEIFIALTPLHKDVLITSEVKETIDTDELILYPYSKAIAQFTIDLVPQTKLTEITYDELLEFDSERGTTKLGQSGK